MSNGNLFSLIQTLAAQLQAFDDIFDGNPLKSPEKLNLLLEQALTQENNTYYQTYIEVVKRGLLASQTMSNEERGNLRRERAMLSGWIEAIYFSIEVKANTEKIKHDILRHEKMINDGSPRMNPGTSVRLAYDGYIAGLWQALELLRA